MRIYSFDDVIGNASTVTTLRRGLQRDSLPHFMIFYGTMGTGKSTCAETLALALTCKNRKGSNPCLVCKSCKTAMSAVMGEKTSNLAKINLGRFNTRADVEQMIKEIFTLQSSVNNCVYILEEAHSLRAELQTALLEELDHLDAHTYVILCTTKVGKLIPELKSRAILFPFKRLTQKESSLLFDSYCKRQDLSLDSQTKEIVLQKASGVARDIIKLIDFTVSNEPTLGELRDLLGEIDDNVFMTLFQFARFGSIYDLLQFRREELEKVSVHDFVLGLKRWWIKIFFRSEGVDVGGDFVDIRGIDTLKLGRMIGNFSAENETDLDFFLIALYQFFHDRRLGDLHRAKATSIEKQKTLASREMGQAHDSVKTLHAFTVNPSEKYDLGGERK